MAKKKGRKKKFTIKFELSIAGLVGLGVVSFCIFLWMFLLGIWAGQTVLPTAASDNIPEVGDFASSLWQKSKDTLQRRKGVENLIDAAKRQISGDKSAEWEAEPDLNEPSVFSLQVGAYKDRKKALQAALAWRARGAASFTLPPDRAGKKAAYRVFVGKYEELSEANIEVSRLASEENVKALITLLTVSQLNNAEP